MSFPAVHLLPLAACLLAAVIWDVWMRKIPNPITGVIAVVGLGVQLWDAGALSALAGLGAGVGTLAVLFVFWQRGGIGGGDVKLAAAVAIWIGLRALPYYWLAAAISGGLVAVVCFAISRRSVRREIQLNLKLAALHREMPDVGTTLQVPGRVSVPYGVAIAAGATFVWWYWQR